MSLMISQRDNVSGMDRLGLMCLAVLLLSPMVFKVRLIGDIVVHPFAPLLLAAWSWTFWAALHAVRHSREPQSAGWTLIALSVALIGLFTAALGASLAFNSAKFGSWRSGGWLLLVKGLLYLAPLSFTALLVMRNGPRVMRLLNIMIPPVALITVVYSFARFMQGPAVSFMNARSESEPRYFVMGMFGEVLSREGLVFRSDTVGQGAYGMYLVLVLAFSIALGLWKGMSAGLPQWYTRGQLFVVCPTALLGVLYSGSRTSLVFLAGVLLILMLLLMSRVTGALTQSHVIRFVVVCSLAAVAVVSARQYVSVSFPALHRLKETITDQIEIRSSALGSFSPLTNEPRKSAVRNIESRVWLWGKVVRYVMEHPMVLLTGVGNDRKRFLEEVVGLPYDGDHIHFQTAHNLFLDVLVKGGLGSLALLLATCAWFFGLAVRAVKVDFFRREGTALGGVGWILLSFWPPFLIVNLLGEEMFTDNLQLHWTMLFGLLLGLLSLAPSRQRLRPRVPGHV